MSDQIKHECGLALIRLLKPLSHYQEHYGTALFGLLKMQLMLQKQRNRGQDGAGLATIKFDTQPGKRYISRRRSNSPQYLKDLFTGAFAHFEDLTQDQLKDAVWLKDNKPYMGELLLGHLRYGTHGKNVIETVHPFLRSNNWISRNLIMAGNFNLTNVNELFEELISFGQYPKEKSDTVTVLEKIGHFLDDEVQRLHSWFKPEGYSNQEINHLISEHLDVQRLLQRACRKFDGGYVMSGLIGHGDAFILRDPAGIRPAYYYCDDDVVVAASERPAIQTAFDVKFDQINELKPGHALIIKKNGFIAELPFKDQVKRRACSFERIYFSRGTDRDIYLERKKLGELLASEVLKEIDYDLEHSIFSFIPNTAEVAFYGLIEGIRNEANKIRKKKLLEQKGEFDEKFVDDLFAFEPRVEKLAVKDAKMRTFIADDTVRGEMVSHVYDVTYGIVKNHVDTLILLDDSIVRGTTLRDSILEIVGRLNPKRIIVVSSAPQIRYPDCYGIDMSKMIEFAAFGALVSLLEDDNKTALLQECYKQCKAQTSLPLDKIKNCVKSLYGQYSAKQLSEKMAEMLTPPNADYSVKIIFQSIENLHEACPHNTGDWYFTGNYPTPGGNRIVNKAFMNFMEKKDERAY